MTTGQDHSRNANGEKTIPSCYSEPSGEESRFLTSCYDSILHGVYPGAKRRIQNDLKRQSGITTPFPAPAGQPDRLFMSPSKMLNPQKVRGNSSLSGYPFLRREAKPACEASSKMPGRAEPAYPSRCAGILWSAVICVPPVFLINPLFL